MKKKYQVFVSSTYEDLKAERQAAVEAILKAGHIPAGMELFTAGDKSQMEVIKQWIEESDIFMLILGARYGSIEPYSGLSYTELEFNYAVEIGKPFFSVVLSDEGRKAKVKEYGESVLELKHTEAYERFREKVLSHHCAFFSTPQEVKLAVLETLPQIIHSRNLTGWVSAADVQDNSELSKELVRLSQENDRLREENERLRKEIDRLKKSIDDSINGLSFEDLYAALRNEKVTVPAGLAENETDIEVSLLELALGVSDHLGRGVSNRNGVSKAENFLFYEVASRLIKYGLVENGKVPSSVKWQRLQLSKEGIKFFSRVATLRFAKKNKKPIPAVTREASEKGEKTETGTPAK